MRTLYKVQFWAGLVYTLVPAFGALSAEAPRFHSLEQVSRLQIPAATGSTFRLVNGASGSATLFIDRVRPEELSALTSGSDERVAGVEVKAAGPDRAELTVRFKNADTDSFAYHQGSFVVLDLWRAEKKAAAAAPIPAPAPATVAPARALASAKPKPVKKAALALVEPLRRDRDIFQKFTLPMPELRADATKPGGFTLPPDANVEKLWAFTAGDKKTDEGRAYELIKKLYADKKFGLALKAIEIGRRDYPKSPYQTELRFLEALAYGHLGEVTETPSLSAKAEATLRQLGSERNEKGEPLPFHRAIRLFFGEKEYLAGRWLEAIQHLEYATALTDANDEALPYLQMMLAECYTKVDQMRRAERSYRYVQQTYPGHFLAREAAYRIVDLLALERNYKRVVEEGFQALKAYPEYEKTRLEVLFQLGEASFWLNRPADAEKYLRRYTRLASGQTNAALAWVRLGETLEVSKGDLAGAREAYLSAKNGYPFSQGDLVATVRVARLDLPVEREPGFIVTRLKELLADQTIDSELRRMAELTLGDYLLLTGAGEEALGLARAGMAQTDGAAYEAYKRNYTKALFAKLQLLVKQKKFAEGLALYDKEREWFELYGAESYRTMAEVYRGLGLYATANEFTAKYAQAAKGRGLASTKSAAALELERAKNSFARGAYAETLQLLPDSDDAEILSMRALSEYRLGRKREAYAPAAAALASEDAEFSETTVLDLLEVTIDRNQEERNFPRMERDLAHAEKLIEGDSERLLFAKGDAAWLQKKHGAAEKAYRAALAKYPKGERADRGRYNLGMSLLSVGKTEEAVKVLTELRDTGSGLWSASAKQELGLIRWENKYSSVLKTLPPAGLGVKE